MVPALNGLRSAQHRVAARVAAALACALCSALLCDPTFAAEGAQVELAPVTVVAPARQTMQSQSDVSGFADVIYTDESWRGFHTAGELLSYSVGAQVSRYGGRDDFATLSVRGSSAGQVKIFLDGVSLSRAQNQVVNLADLPLDAVERIEVYRGYTPTYLGASGAASVVNIVTKRDTKPVLRASASWGSFDTRKLAVQAALPTRLGMASGYVTVRSSDGDFSYVDDRGTPSNPDDDVRATRRNNDHTSVDALGRLEIPLASGASATVSDNVFHKEEGVPGLGANTSDTARLRVTRNIVGGSWQSRDGDAGASADLTYLREVFREPPCPTGAQDCSTIGLGFEESDNTTWAATTRVHGARTFARNQALEASVETGFESFLGRLRTTQTQPRSRQQRVTVALAASDEIRFERLGLSLIPQLRHERLWNSFDATSIPFLPNPDLPSARVESTDPRLGVRWDASGGLTVKGNVGSYFRPPNFGEEFGSDGFTTANPELKPETGTNMDIGFQWRSAAGDGRGRIGPLSRIAFEYAYFRNAADDMIVYVQTGQRVARAQNVAAASVHGHELRLESHAGRYATLVANFTHQRATNESDEPGISGARLPGLPSDEAYARLGYDRGPWSVSYEIDYESARFFDEANLLAVPAQTLHNVSLAYRPCEGLELRVEADNLGDDQTADQNGFPVPGRTVYLTVSYERGADER